MRKKIIIIDSVGKFYKEIKSFPSYQEDYFLRIKKTKVLIKIDGFLIIKLFDFNNNFLLDESFKIKNLFYNNIFNMNYFEEIFKYLKDNFPLSDEEEIILEIIS